jgi:DNA polymerase (family 10)
MAKEEFGLKFSISTDSHDVGHLDLLGLGANVARRGWLEVDDVINTKEDPFA